MYCQFEKEKYKNVKIITENCYNRTMACHWNSFYGLFSKVWNTKQL